MTRGRNGSTGIDCNLLAMAIEAAPAARSGNPPAGAAIVKRSIAIAGHRTSVSLEEAFWRELKVLAQRRDQSVSALVAAIDAERKSANLSSAIRVFVLEDVAGRLLPRATGEGDHAKHGGGGRGGSSESS